MNYIVDSHAHYDDKMFDNDRDILLNSMLENNICLIINCGVDLKSSNKSIDLAKKYDFIRAAVGIHPHEASKADKSWVNQLESLIANKEVVSLGEIGLDYHYDFSCRDDQLKIFEKQLSISKDFNIPIIVHNREAHEDTLNLLKKYKPRGVVHCFSGSEEMAKEITSLGMYIGVGGAVTFKNAKTLPLVVSSIPIEHILLETDCPYMAPVPFRGTRCDSSHIKVTAQKVSEIKGISYDDVLNITTKNAFNLFSITQKGIV